MAEFKQVKRISQREKDIVYGYIKRIQNIFFPFNENPYYIIVQLIQDLCLLYYRALIDTKILTNDEQRKLLEMINNHRYNKLYANEWKLLYRRSRDGASRYEFYEKCDKMDKTICIIQTPQNNVFGGYTSLKWDKYASASGENLHDPTAFIYLIRSQNKKYVEPKIWELQNHGRGPIQYYVYGYLSFGVFGTAFYFSSNGAININTYKNVQYNLDARVLNGQGFYTEPIQVEVFQIIDE